MAETFKLYKLIILCMLDQVDFPLTNSQISEFILDEGYTTYFKLQQALSELLSSGFHPRRSNPQQNILSSDRRRRCYDTIF